MYKQSIKIVIARTTIELEGRLNELLNQYYHVSFGNLHSTETGFQIVATCLNKKGE